MVRLRGLAVCRHCSVRVHVLFFGVPYWTFAELGFLTPHVGFIPLTERKGNVFTQTPVTSGKRGTRFWVAHFQGEPNANREKHYWVYA